MYDIDLMVHVITDSYLLKIINCNNEEWIRVITNQ